MEVEKNKDMDPEVTLLAPFMVGSTLKMKVQKEEDCYAKLMHCRRVRIVKAGGDKFAHLLGQPKCVK